MSSDGDWCSLRGCPRVGLYSCIKATEVAFFVIDRARRVVRLINLIAGLLEKKHRGLPFVSLEKFFKIKEIVH